MIALKYPNPEVSEAESLFDKVYSHVFTLPVRGETSVSARTSEHMHRLSHKIRRKVSGVFSVLCHVQRVGVTSCVSLTLKGDTGRINILVTAAGHERWPTEEEYERPRWHINVTDSADMLYFAMWLSSQTENATYAVH